MLSAFSVSVVFLACYLIYHFNAGIVYYQKTGLLRYVYLTILTTHTILAVITPVLAIITLAAGAADGCRQASRHRALDISDLDVCECYRSHRVPYVVPGIGRIQKSELRIQNALHVGFETSTGFFQQRHSRSGLSIMKVGSENEVVTALFERRLGDV